MFYLNDLYNSKHVLLQVFSIVCSNELQGVVRGQRIRSGLTYRTLEAVYSRVG